jgi:hypothetical protein
MPTLRKNRKPSIVMSSKTRTTHHSTPLAKMGEDPQDEFATILNAEVRKEASQMGADGGDGQPQLVGDLLVRPPAQ